MALDAQVIAVGETEGIRFAFDKMERTPNTVDAHRLIWLADQRGCQDAVVEAVFLAYFSHGRDIGNTETIIDVAVEADLERQVVEEMLSSDDAVEAIAAGRELSRQHSVDSVPFFIINGEISLPGAQESATFLKAFKLAAG